jgi:hypothetical protein
MQIYSAFVKDENSSSLEMENFPLHKGQFALSIEGSTPFLSSAKYLIE